MIDWQSPPAIGIYDALQIRMGKMSSLRDRYDQAGVEAPRRRTLRAAISCVGRGLHGGAEVRVNLVPAAPGAGIVFHRTDIAARIPARFDHVVETRLCTVVASPHDLAARVGTIEHLMAALSAAGVDDLIVEVDGPELPILDGSAAPFLFLIESAGTVCHGGPRARIEILRPVRVEKGDAFAEFAPHGRDGAGLDLALVIEFPAAAIGAQAMSLSLDQVSFAAELAAARTFTLAQEVEAMRGAGLAKGGSLANAIVVDGEKVLNPEGLRWPDEFVRHKMLDVVGDLALAGAPLCGSFVGRCTGHGLNNRLLRALFADPANYRLATPVMHIPMAAVA